MSNKNGEEKLFGEAGEQEKLIKKDIFEKVPLDSKTDDEPKPLTTEEQMARYEDDLKDTDWGHQPC